MERVLSISRVNHSQKWIKLRDFRMSGGQDITIKMEGGRFNYRVGGIVIKDGKVLLLTEDRFDFWYVPGGRTYLFETSEEAIKREIHEELGVVPIIERILWTTECLYHFNAWNIKHHDLTFYYLVSLPKDSSIYFHEFGIGKEEFSNEQTVLRFRWFDIEKLQTINLVPHFLKNVLKNIPLTPSHLILNELKGTSQK